MLGLAASLRNNTAGGLGLNFVHSNGYAMNYGIRSLFTATYLKLQSLNDLGFSKTYVMLQAQRIHAMLHALLLHFQSIAEMVIW